MPSDNKRFDHEGERPVANAVVVKSGDRRPPKKKQP